MRILQFGKFYPPDYGGIQSAMYDITEELNNRGIGCDVLCSNTKRRYKEEEISGYRVYRTRTLGIVASTSISPQMVLKLKQISQNYDIIHIHQPDPMANLALFLDNPKKQKIVLHWHSDIIKQKFLSKLFGPFIFWLLNRADVIIATSPPYIDSSPFLSKYKDKTEVVPRGIRPLKYDYEKVQKIKNQYLGKKIIFSLGRFVYYKGIEYLVKSAEFLDNNCVILIGGSGPDDEKLRNLAKNYGDKVCFLGVIPQDDLGSYYKACDVFCLPSVERSEAFGLVMVEAMSFSKPIVATKIYGSGVSWVNQDMVTGLNVEPNNPKQLANALAYILNNDEVYRKFSENAYQRFYKEFRIEREIDRLVEIYNRLL